MKVGWLLVVLLWLVPTISMLACPSDLHGSSSCSSAAQLGRTASFYLVAPGLWLGSAISDLLSRDPRAGASVPAFALGVTCWLAALSAIIVCTAKALARSASR